MGNLSEHPHDYDYHSEQGAGRFSYPPHAAMQHYGHGYRGGWVRPPFGFILPMIVLGFLFFGALKFLWPLLLFGLVFMFVRGAMRGGWGHGGWGRDWGKQWGKDWGRGWHSEGKHWHPGRWGWDADTEKPKRKNDDDDEDDDKPKRDGDTLYV